MWAVALADFGQIYPHLEFYAEKIWAKIRDESFWHFSNPKTKLAWPETMYITGSSDKILHGVPSQDDEEKMINKKSAKGRKDDK